MKVLGSVVMGHEIKWKAYKMSYLLSYSEETSTWISEWSAWHFKAVRSCVIISRLPQQLEGKDVKFIAVIADSFHGMKGTFSKHVMQWEKATYQEHESEQ